MSIPLLLLMRTKRMTHSPRLSPTSTARSFLPLELVAMVNIIFILFYQSSLLNVYLESMDMGRSDVMADRRLRLASSSPDVKAMFNSPAYIYNIEQEEADPNYLPAPPVPGLDYWTPLAPIVCCSLIFTGSDISCS